MQREGLYILPSDLSTFTIIVADNPKNTDITTKNRRKNSGYRGYYNAQRIGTIKPNGEKERKNISYRGYYNAQRIGTVISINFSFKFRGYRGYYNAQRIGTTAAGMRACNEA